MRNLKKVLSLALALVMLLGMMVVGAGAAEFKDADGIKNTEAVDVVSGIGVLQGDENGNFNPEGTLSRAEAAVVVAKLDLGAAFGNLETTNASTFSDVPAGYWGKPYIDYCFARGLIAGVGNNKYNPNGKVTGVEFALMVSRVLGYEDKAEQVGGADWEVDAAALARKAGLTVDVTLGSLPMTRDEMAQVTYNALKANMVEYKNGTINIDVGGTPVTIGGNPATPKANSKAHYDASVKQDNILQLCEEKFPQLTVRADEDAFARPVNVWTYKREDIAEVPTAAHAEYTAGTKGATIASALKVGNKVAVEYYEDGLQNEDIKTVADLKSVKEAAGSIGGNGVLTQAWYDEVEDSVKVTLIHTYVGTVSSVVKATASAKRYVNISKKSTRTDLDPKFTTEDFESRDLVTYTCAYSESAGQYKIQEVDVLEKTATATLTKWTGINTGDSKNSFTAGETYNYNVDSYIDVDGTKGNISAFAVGNSELDVYCDKYGYAIYVIGVEAAKDYAVVIGKGSANQYGSETVGATLLFADGTTKEVIAKYTAAANGSVDLSEGDSTSGVVKTSGENLVTDMLGDIVTYRVNKDGVYELTMGGLNAVKDSATGAWDEDNYAADNDVTFVNGRSLLTLNCTAGTNASNAAYDKTIYTTEKTVFFVATKSGSSVVYNVYTGYSKMPSLKTGASTAAKGVAYVLNSDYTTQADAVFIAVDSVKGMSANQTFVVKQKDHEVISDSDGKYFVMPAIDENGDVVEVKVDAETLGADSANPPTKLDNVGDVQVIGVVSMSDVTKDKNDIYTNATFDTPTSSASFSNGVSYYKTTGLVAPANGVIGLGDDDKAAAIYWAYTGNTNFYEVSENFKTLTKVSASDIMTDDNDTVYFVADDDATASYRVVKTVIVQKVKDGSTTPPPTTPTDYGYTVGYLGNSDGSKNVQILIGKLKEDGSVDHWLSKTEIEALKITADNVYIENKGEEVKTKFGLGQEGTVYPVATTADTDGNGYKYQFDKSPIAVFEITQYDGKKATGSNVGTSSATTAIDKIGYNCGFMKIHVEKALELDNATGETLKVWIQIGGKTYTSADVYDNIP